MTVEDVREFAATLPRAYEVRVRGRLKFRVKQIVFLAFSKEGDLMGSGFPKEWRATLVENEPQKFALPGESDMRFNWVHVRLDKIDRDEMQDLVENAWALCVPRYVAAEYKAAQGYE